MIAASAAVIAALLAFAPVTGAVADAPAPQIELTWNALSPTVQKSGEQFAYLASLSCHSLSGEACTDVVLEAPYSTARLHPAATALADWSKSVSASVNGVSVGDLAWRDTGTSLVVELGTLRPGEQSNVTFRIVPPARTTSNGTSWATAIAVRGSHARGAEAAPIEMTAQARFLPAVSTVLSDLEPGTRVLKGTRVSYRLTLGDVTGGPIGAVGLDPHETARLTDVLPSELEVVSCSDGCSVDGQTVRWHVDQTRVPVAVTVTAVVRETAVVGAVFRNSASATFTSLFGEEATATSNSVHAVVAGAPAPHDVFSKEAVGNLGDTTPSALGHITAERASSYLLKVTGQPNAIDYVVRDPLPCRKEGGVWVSLPTTSTELCADPAYVVTSVSAGGAGVSFPRVATLRYSDGTSDTFTAVRRGDVFDVPRGKTLSRLEASGTLAAGSGTLVYTVTGKPAPFAAADDFANVAGFAFDAPGAGPMLDLRAELETHRREGAAIAWQTSPASSPDLVFRRMANLDPKAEGAGYNWSYVGWWPQFFSTPEKRTAEGAAAVILPKGFAVAERNAGRFAKTDDWRAAGQRRYVLSGRDGNVTGAGGPAFNIVIDRADPPAPGLHTYDMFVGFRDATFDDCLLMSGTAAPGNTLLTDTSGIIGSTAGVETTLCHVQGTLLVLGDDPGVALHKSVRSTASPQWSNTPETIVGIAEDDVVDFLLAWSNPGATEVDEVVVYDVFARSAGDETVAGAARGSSMSLTLAEAPDVPDGWTAEYSTADDPCRPEVRRAEEEAGCVDDWRAALANISEATAIRLVKEEPAAVGATMLVTLPFVAPDVEEAVAYNTAASAVSLVAGDGKLIPLAPLETPRVGAKRIPLPEPEPEATPEPEPEATPTPEPEPEPEGGPAPEPRADAPVVPAPAPEAQRTPAPTPTAQPQAEESGALARTGGDIAWPLLGIGAALLGGGVLLLRHRRTRQS